MRIIIILCAIAMGGVVIGLLFRFVARWRLFHGRPLMSVEDIHKTLPQEPSVPVCLFRDVLTLVAKCYHLQPELLRMDDDFEGNLAKLDSWSLGGGAESLAERITHDFHVTLPDQSDIRTVGELICFVNSVQPTEPSRLQGGATKKNR